MLTFVFINKNTMIEDLRTNPQIAKFEVKPSNALEELKEINKTVSKIYINSNTYKEPSKDYSLLLMIIIILLSINIMIQ